MCPIWWVPFVELVMGAISVPLDEEKRMEYLVLLYDDETTAPHPGTPEWDADMEGFAAFSELAGHAIRGGEALWDTSTARTVRAVDGSVRVTNGPFAETTEAVGGYFILEAPSLDDAIELARNIPTATTGAIEIRPMVMQFTNPVERPVPEGAARYLATIHGPSSEEPEPATPEWDRGAADHRHFGDAAGDVLLGGGAVHSATAATTIRVRDGELLVTDGPFAEATEITGGYYLLCGTPEETAAAAGQIPVNPNGWVELRKVMEFDA